MAAEPENRTARITELDALRGVAALAVVLFHFTTRFDQMFGHTSAGETAAPVFWAPWGHYGVDLFFMLSGYVILMSLQRSRSAAQFAWGRLTRLYPTYWVAAAFTFTAVSLVGLPGEEVSLRDAVLNTTMLQALLGGRHIDGAYWSLQAEVIFYANALVLWRLGVLKRPLVAVLGWVAAAVACQMAIRWAASADPMLFDVLRKVRTVASLEYIPFFGVGLVLRSTDSAAWLRCLALVGCFGAIAVTQDPTTLGVDVALAGLMAAAVSGKARWLGWAPLVWLGAISYPLYLIHQNIGYMAIRHLEAVGASPTAAVAVATLLGVLLGSWLHRGVETPSLAALRKIDPTRPIGARPPTATAP